ncbi:MAG: hypothetical protein A3A96_00675 [Candidatus Zambryskibacteria bacterium RIFCSPLOWO2_01_FULL_39_39]|uniref:DUF5667 domain-containing protein n=1 Tax=Candidatus Zambryskibacteria bacterium RIFCSPLOWO2_01_FULL_39_39 TaxID=1802758 RepID=A0A1G2TZ87_9BACT|nr:MAG: hypothetical protein UT00_C0004G0030 [Parcubacteria group bacterium GW2011_GWA1_38_7]OHA87778.1 MAG: hypothetical protein A2644_01220 [Candidatus Zambryskibacteria bacterium RIFCSPHIGHO2_01_FULL_39_63]OHA94997.1 MAG: hypothetical protein A3B88_01295 [Candidatus Zambryskibacteria bacterium RIFCSPHIGHO2_02_FULL_39_19]OHA99178.1 MAG: hypothetical protein A3F20_03245 [Candidatus Zambryskibacteria bacterium RIFCSPHIGHO2_12_FULL_39_21]OHB01940.1 MAG: hypothetical protein A3A96_00675 [Candidat
MNNQIWKKGIEDLKNIKLSKDEKDLLYKQILEGSSTPRVPILSPFLFFVRSHAPILSMSLVLVLLGGVSVAAENSLPGNVLYPMKVSVTEPLRDIIKIKPEEKIKWQAEKATRRLMEAEILSVQNRLDDKKRDRIEKLFEKSISDFDDGVSRLATSSDNNRLEDIKSEFNRRISAHSKVAEKVNENKSKIDSAELDIFEKNVSGAIQKNKKEKERKKEVESKNEKKDREEREKEDQEKIDKIVERRLKELEKELDKSEREEEKD